METGFKMLDWNHNNIGVVHLCILVSCLYLGAWSLLLSSEESVEGHIGHLADLESDSGNVSNSVTFTTESRDQDLENI